MHNVVFYKRGLWCYKTVENGLQKFKTEEEAKIAAGWVEPAQETNDAEEEGEEKDCEEETSTDEQETVRVGKSNDEEEV